MRLLLFTLPLLSSQLTQAQSVARPDVLLLINGDEIPGRVLAVSSTSISYCALNRPDTLRFDTDAVFLIRYANGSREAMRGNWTAPALLPPPAPDVLAGLSPTQRRALGLRDARRCYTSRSSFWISAGAGLQGGPLLGALGPAIVTAHTVADSKLQAPQPARLADPSYRAAYQQEVRRMRRGRAWGGYALGTAAWLLLLSALSGAH
jgi:hypothetical protein